MAETVDINQYRVARQYIDSMASGGWDGVIQDVELAASPGNKAFLYLFDRVTRWTWMGVTPQPMFKEVSEAGKKARESDRDTVRGALGYLVTHLADGGGRPTRQEQQDLGVLASMYAGGTKVFAAANGFPEGCHFVVVVYRKPGGGTVMLRPFAIDVNADKPVSTDILESMLDQVIRMDKLRHPAWIEGEKD